ncbi:MAG TPA: FliM/FliN family flagellar motor switch protein [Isosphaeraceae bacterium]|nr:FliM/FliN family flagellar motor switch protein [Isosphaeraceae bacterium]
MSREPQTVDQDPRQAVGTGVREHSGFDADPFGWLPRMTLRQVRLERLLEGWLPDDRLPASLRWLDELMGTPIELSRPEVQWRASGLQRPSLVVQLTAPRLATKLAVGIEISLAHTIVDHMLGFDRAFAESRLQLTPVEWGIGTFLALRVLDSLAGFAAQGPGGTASIESPFDPGDVTVDRVGPDPFDPTGLGAIVTVRWSVRAGEVTAAVRLWLAESSVTLWTASFNGYPAGRSEPWPRDDGPGPSSGSDRRLRRAALSGIWRAVAGQVLMPRGLARLRIGGVLPISDSHLTGAPASPGGTVELVMELDNKSGEFRMPACPVADSAARLLRIDARPIYQTRARDPIAGTIQEGPHMNQPSSATTPPAAAPPAPLDVPVTLTVELGRVNLTVSQVADLKPGDVVELARNSRAPVELTSNGRLVARGELILIDTDLGVRVTNVFL